MNWFPLTFSIESGTNTSNVIDTTLYGYNLHSHRFLFAVPGTVAETLNIQLSFDNVTYVTLQSGAADIVLAVDKATQLYGVQARYIRLRSGVNVAATRTIQASIAPE